MSWRRTLPCVLSADSFIVYGRGVLHLSILIETMRREGFELQVGQPKVIDKNIGGVRCEPIELLTIDLPEDMVGKAIEMSTRRKASLTHMETRGDRAHLEFDIPSRGLIGLRSNLMTATQGEAVVAHRFKGYEPYKGEIEKRNNGSLVSLETGLSVAYAMDKLQDRGRFFIDPGEEIYAGQVVGEGRGDICRSGGRRAYQGERPGNQYLQDQEADQYESLGVRRKGDAAASGQVLP